MSTTPIRSEATASDARAGKVDMKLEVVTIPVSDVDRATDFYLRLGWRQDVTPPGSGVVQLTPPGSACSVHFGKNRTSAAPGSAEGLWLIVSDIRPPWTSFAGPQPRGRPLEYSASPGGRLVVLSLGELTKEELTRLLCEAEKAHGEYERSVLGGKRRPSSRSRSAFTMNSAYHDGQSATRP